MSYSTIDWRIDAGLLRLTLNRPAQMNAFTVKMANELEHAFNRASQDDDRSMPAQKARPEPVTNLTRTASFFDEWN
jgi:hypothetical protein